MPDYEDLLAASISSDFGPPSSIPKLSVGLNRSLKSAEPTVADTSATTSEGSGVAAESESWKADYEKYVEHWRAESAVARRMAEETRAMWEQRRAEDLKMGKTREEDWEKVHDKGGEEESPVQEESLAVVGGSSPSPADVRDLVSGETEKGMGIERLESMLPPITQPDPPYPSTLNEYDSPSAADKEKPIIDSLAASHQWSHLHTSESSYPDISFPSHLDTPPDQTTSRAALVPRPPSATLTVFDSSLSLRTRLLALSASIGINFLLPFVNGVMLGFGEIFAKNVVGWLGWNTQAPGRVATAIGIGAVSAKRREKME